MTRSYIRILPLLLPLALATVIGLFAPANAQHAPSAELQAFREKAEQGNINLQYFFGKMYEEGLGVPPDFEEAAYWFRKAAQQGHADAQHSFGTLYEEGLGVPQNFEKAGYWYRKAAEQGNAAAQHRLDLMHREDQSTP